MIIKKERFEALDILRGLTMLIMALDHSRYFFALGYVSYAPTDIDLTNLEVFFTRWITHLAAPIFIFLSGIGLFFASSRRTKSQLAYLAISRGIWLIFLELTLVGFFWAFSTDFILHPKVGVLFVIGLCMIIMGFLIYLPKYIIGIIATVMLLGHNSLDFIHAYDFTSYGWLWNIIHDKGAFYIGEIEVRVIYPFIPWVAVMASGYLFGPIVKKQRDTRKKIFFATGLSLVILAIVLRFTNIYGDISLWNHYTDFDSTLISFLNFTKYPPSLIFLSFFIGIGLLLMYAFDRKLGRWTLPLRYFGQVPFFFYILHIPLLHLGAIVMALLVFNDASWLFSAKIGYSGEYSYGSDLLAIYSGWIITVAMLYYPSKKFAEFKAKRKDWWLSYL